MREHARLYEDVRDCKRMCDDMRDRVELCEIMRADVITADNYNVFISKL